MDWYSWLSKSSLPPSLTYEYGLLFNQNELEPGDAVHFDHELLKSMGISIAKHRLEILKLAKKDQAKKKSSSSYAHFVHRAKKCLAKCVRKVVRHDGRGSSVTVVPRICNGDDVRVGVQRRNVKKMVLMITDGGGAGRLSASQKASLMFHDCYEDDDGDGDGGDDENDRCSENGGEIKWDSMFQDLKPT